MNKEETVLVYDLGGGTFDVSVIKLIPGVNPGDPSEIKVLATNGDDLLGGKDWDDRLYKLAKKKLKEECDADIDDNSEVGGQLRSDIEGYKIKLSGTKGECKVKTDEGNVKILREEFEAETADLLSRTCGFIDNALMEAGITDGDISRVLLVGGSTKMPSVQDLLKARFGDERVQFNNPNEAVALGAAFICDLNWADDLKKRLEGGEIEIVRNADGSYTAVNKKTGEKTDITDNIENKEDKKEISVLGEEDGNVNILTGMTTGGFIFRDGIPRSIGLVVLCPELGPNVYIADNVLKKGETGPERDEIKRTERDYYTSVDNQTSVMVPVVESLCKEDRFEVQQIGNRLDTLTITCDHPEYSMVQCNLLVMKLVKPLPAGSPLHVIFTVDSMGNMVITVEDVINHTSEKIDFRYTR